MRVALLWSALVALPALADSPPAALNGLLEVHNHARAAVGVPPLQWSDALASEAQSWAQQLSRENCRLRYDPDPQRRETTGQNLYRAYSNSPYAGYRKSPAEAAERWLREGQSYDHLTHQCAPGLGSQCGAYLQAIWETTTALGCGQARCDTAEVWVCHYAPRGGQEGIKPYGNTTPLASPVAEAAAVPQCGWTGPTPAEQLIQAVEKALPPP
jgi:hypothetical protein